MEEPFGGNGTGNLDGIAEDTSAQDARLWENRGAATPHIEDTHPAPQPVPPMSPNGSLWASILRQQPPASMASSLVPTFPRPDPGVPSSHPRYANPADFAGMAGPGPQLDTAMLPKSVTMPKPNGKGAPPPPAKSWYQALPWWIWAMGGVAGWYWVKRYRDGK